MEQTHHSEAELKYEMVKKNILSLIESEALMPNDKIPGENEIARRFNVSVITARKALSDLVNDGFIYRIKGKGSFVALANDPAKKQRLRMIVFLLPASESGDSSFTKMIKGAQSCCAAHGYPILIEVSNDEIEAEKELIEKAVHDKMSALIIYSIDPEKNISSFSRLKEEGIPFVLIDRYTEQVPYNVVSSHNTDGAFQATEHLIQLGHRKIAFAAYDYSIITEQMRHKGYRLALQAYGIKEDSSLFSNHSVQNATDLYRKIKNGELTSIVCANDYCALKLMDCFLRWGMSIPEDVSIVGYDGIKSTEYVLPTLTTVIQNFYEIGEAAGAAVVEALENTRRGVKQVFLPTELSVRESTAPPKNVSFAESPEKAQ